MQLFKFKPILKQTIWGGERIIPFKGLSDEKQNVGESWEISGVPGDESIVADGPEAGMTLPKLVGKYRAELVGEDNYKRFGFKFPLLIKFIDAKQDLSIQVHPDDEMAQLRHDSMGKTEMWYVIDAAPGAKLRSGMSQSITPTEYKDRVMKNTITDVIQEYDVKQGDVFFLPAGRVHSIGAGCFIAEIQETSNITYRIYDFDRRGKDGKTRELHTDLAQKAINYEVLNDYRTKYTVEKNEPIELVACTHFVTSLYDINEEITADYSELDSFVIYVCMQGGCTLTNDEGDKTYVEEGESILIPATAEYIKIVPDKNGVKFLETYV